MVGSSLVYNILLAILAVVWFNIQGFMKVSVLRQFGIHQEALLGLFGASTKVLFIASTCNYTCHHEQPTKMFLAFCTTHSSRHLRRARHGRDFKIRGSAPSRGFDAVTALPLNALAKNGNNFVKIQEAAFVLFSFVTPIARYKGGRIHVIVHILDRFDFSSFHVPINSQKIKRRLNGLVERLVGGLDMQVVLVRQKAMKVIHYFCTSSHASSIATSFFLFFRGVGGGNIGGHRWSRHSS